MSHQIKLNEDIASPQGLTMVSTIQTVAGGASISGGGLLNFNMTDEDTSDTPWLFETMCYIEEIGYCFHRPYAKKAEALRGHKEIVALVKAGTLPIGRGVMGIFNTPIMTVAEWKILQRKKSDKRKVKLILYSTMPSFGRSGNLKPEFVRDFLMKNYRSPIYFWIHTHVERWNRQLDFFWQYISIDDLHKRIDEEKAKPLFERHSLLWYASYKTGFEGDKKEDIDYRYNFTLGSFSRIDPYLVEAIEEYKGELYDRERPFPFEDARIITIPSGRPFEIIQHQGIEKALVDGEIYG